MADIKSPEERSRNMSAIRSSNTKPELFIRKLLFSRGYRYRLQAKSIPGHPDIWLKKYNTAIFINGCFWHRHAGCKYAYMPKSRLEFWGEKFSKNTQRDAEVRQQLYDKRIKCLVIWECSIRGICRKNSNPEQLLKRVEEFLLSENLYENI